MTNQNSLIYPTVDLFLYDLKVGLGQDEKKLASNRKEFWQKIYHDIQPNSQLLEKLKQAEDNSGYVELLGSQKIKPFQNKLDGYYYPVQLGDIYGLQVDCTANFINNYESKAQSVDCLQKLQQEILSHINNEKAKLGQTWLISGQLSTSNQDAEKTAQECYAQLELLSKKDWKTDLKGVYLGGTVFELSRLPSEFTLEDGYHILICIFPHNIDIKKIQDTNEKLYPKLLKLFSYRHKILWAYSQSRQLKNNLQEGAKLVQETVIDLNELNRRKININQLQQILAKTPDILLKYTNNLIYLDDQRRTIKVNISNYDKRWQSLTELDSGSDWKFFKEFSEFAEEKFLAQIESEYANFSSRLALMENTIKTIQGIIDLEKAKSERSLDTTIALAGIGLSLSGLTASAISAKQPPITSYKDFSFIDTPVFFWSLIFSAPFLIALIFRLIRRR